MLQLSVRKRRAFSCTQKESVLEKLPSISTFSSTWKDVASTSVLDLLAESDAASKTTTEDPAASSPCNVAQADPTRRARHSFPGAAPRRGEILQGLPDDYDQILRAAGHDRTQSEWTSD